MGLLESYVDKWEKPLRTSLKEAGDVSKAVMPQKDVDAIFIPDVNGTAFAKKCPNYFFK